MDTLSLLASIAMIVSFVFLAVRALNLYKNKEPSKLYYLFNNTVLKFTIFVIIAWILMFVFAAGGNFSFSFASIYSFLILIPFVLVIIATYITFFSSKYVDKIGLIMVTLTFIWQSYLLFNSKIEGPHVVLAFGYVLILIIIYSAGNLLASLLAKSYPESEKLTANWVETQEAKEILSENKDTAFTKFVGKNIKTADEKERERSRKEYMHPGYMAGTIIIYSVLNILITIISILFIRFPLLKEYLEKNLMYYLLGIVFGGLFLFFIKSFIIFGIVSQKGKQMKIILDKTLFGANEKITGSIFFNTKTKIQGKALTITFYGNRNLHKNHEELLEIEQKLSGERDYSPGEVIKFSIDVSDKVKKVYKEEYTNWMSFSEKNPTVPAISWSVTCDLEIPSDIDIMRSASVQIEPPEIDSQIKAKGIEKAKKINKHTKIISIIVFLVFIAFFAFDILKDQVVEDNVQDVITRNNAELVKNQAVLGEKASLVTESFIFSGVAVIYSKNPNFIIVNVSNRINRGGKSYILSEGPFMESICKIDVQNINLLVPRSLAPNIGSTQVNVTMTASLWADNTCATAYVQKVEIN